MDPISLTKFRKLRLKDMNMLDLMIVKPERVRGLPIPGPFAFPCFSSRYCNLSVLKSFTHRRTTESLISISRATFFKSQPLFEVEVNCTPMLSYSQTAALKADLVDLQI